MAVKCALAIGVLAACSVAWARQAPTPPRAQPPEATATARAEQAPEATGSVEAEIAAVEDIEQVEQVDVAEPATKRWIVIEIIGKLHPLTVHFPIGWLILLVLVELGALLLRRPVSPQVTLLLLAGAVLVCVPAMTTGLIRAGSQGVGPTDLVLLHRNLMFGSAACSVVALGIRWWRRRRSVTRVAKGVYLFLLLAAAGLMTLGGHLGARLVFGESYLPF